jgi:hypothetical protein
MPALPISAFSVSAFPSDCDLYFDRMRTVTRSVIEATWKRLGNLDQAASQELARQFMEAQPALGLYVAAQHENLLEQGADSPLIELCLAAWQAMTETAAHSLPQASPEAIDAAEDANAKELERLEQGSEFEWQDKAAWMAKRYQQHELLGFGIEVLMAPHEDQPELAPETLGLELLCFKTVLDCLDRHSPV